MFSTRNRARQEFQLRIARFRKLLEDAQRLLELVRDANEKYNGDFIFDRQYIVSLVSEAMKRANKLVFHAHVLSPEGSDALFKMYDACSASARDILADRPRSRLVDGAGGGGSKPGELTAKDPAAGADRVTGTHKNQADESNLDNAAEFRLLSRVIEWLSEASPPVEHSVLDLLDGVMDQAIQGLEVLWHLKVRTRLWSIPEPKNRYHVDLIDLDELKGWPERGSISGQDLDCRPLELVMLGAGEAAPNAVSSTSAEPIRWLAAVGDNRLSLSMAESGGRIYLDAALTGHFASDYVFVFRQSLPEVRDFWPPGFARRTTGRGDMGWRFAVPYRDLEEGLIELGRVLASPAPRPFTSRPG
jgi:hypothetical protein